MNQMARFQALDRNLKRRRAEVQAEADKLDALSEDIAGRIERLEGGNVVPITSRTRKDD